MIKLEFYGLLIRRQHIHPATRGDSIKDVKRIIHDIGWIRQSWSLELRIKQWFSRNTSFWSTKDIKYLLKREDIIQVHNGQRTIFVSVDDAPLYISAYRTKVPNDNRLIQLLNILDKKGAMTNKDLQDESKLDKQTFRWAIDLLKVTSNIVVDYKGKFIALPEQISSWFDISQEDAFKEIIRRFIYSYPPISISKLVELTALRRAIVERVIQELEKSGDIKTIKDNELNEKTYCSTDVKEINLEDLTDEFVEGGYYIVPQLDPLWHFFKKELKKAFNISWGDIILHRGKIIAAMNYIIEKERRKVIIDLHIKPEFNNKQYMQQIVDLSTDWAKRHTYFEPILRLPLGKVKDNIQLALEVLLDKGYKLSKDGLIKHLS